MRFSRREMLGAATVFAGAAGASASVPARAIATARGGDLDEMIVIDGNSAVIAIDRPGQPHDAPDADMIRSISASGLTAISMTIGQGTDGDRFGRVIQKIAGYGEKIAAASDTLMRIRTAADIRTAKKTKRLGLIYNIQDTALLDTDVARIATLQQVGVRIVQLTYNRRNWVGDGGLEGNDGGLSNFGHEVVRELNARNLLVDLSHGGSRLVRQAIEASSAPPVISHAGCRALVDLPRNVDDAEMRLLAERGGVFGIYFMPFLSPTPPATTADVVRHIEHALNVCGEDHIGIGSDGTVPAMRFDEATLAANRAEHADRVRANIAAPGETPDGTYYVPDLNEPDRMYRLADALARRGWPSARIEKLMGANFLRVFGEAWGG